MNKTQTARQNVITRILVGALAVSSFAACNQNGLVNQGNDGAPADLSITKTIKSAPLTSGGLEHYVLTITNAGPGASGTPLTVTDSLPAGVTLDSSFATTQGNWTCSTAIVCTSSTAIPAGGSEQIVIPVNVTANQGVIKNCASIKAPNDPKPQNNEGCVSADVVPQSKPVDMAIRKQLIGKDGLPATNLTAGGIGTYQLTVINVGGPVGSGPVMVLDPMPAGLTLQLPVTPANWNCAASTPTLLSCMYTGSFAIPTGFTDSIVFDVKVSKKLVGKVENCAKLSVPGDTVLSNNGSCHVAPVKNPYIAVELSDALEAFNDGLNGYLEEQGTEAAAQDAKFKWDVKTTDPRLRLTGDWSWSEEVPASNNAKFKWDTKSQEARFYRAVKPGTGGSVQEYTIGIHCDISFPPLRVRCTIFLADLDAKSARTLNDLAGQLEQLIVATGDEAAAREKATTGLKDTLKTQVRLVAGTSVTPEDGNPDNVFVVNQEGVAEALTITIKCWIEYPPLSVGCTITISL